MIGISIANSTEWESTLEYFRKTHDECLISPYGEYFIINYLDKEEGYVPDFLGINSPAYGDDINFDTDCNGFILKWKEKNIKEQIIEFLQKRLINE